MQVENKGPAHLITNMQHSSSIPSFPQSQTISTVTSQSQGLSILISTTPLSDVINNPGRYGFEEVSKGCCGTGKIETVVLCNELNPFTCTDVSKYVFWDGYHPTEKAYQQLFGPIVNNYINSFF